MAYMIYFIIILFSFALGNFRIPLKKKDINLNEVAPLRYREDVISERLGDRPVNAIIIHDLNEFMRINANQTLYYGPLFIGSSKQKLNFVYDTGSSWLWFPKKGCVGCPTQNQFNATNSISFTQTGKQVELFYGKGHVNGTIVTDQVYLNNTETSSVSMKMLAIESAEDLEGTQADGILGLAPIPSSGADSFVKKLADSLVIDGACFTVYLGQLSEDSYIEFGKYKGSTENVTWIPLINTAYWMVTLNSFAYQDSDLRLSSNKAVLDTGSSIMGFPTDDLKRIIFAVKGNRQLYYLEDINFYAVKCSSVNEFTHITVDIGGHLTQIPNNEYLIKISDYCIFYIFDLGASVKFILLGDTYLRNSLVIHDIDNKRIGMFNQSNRYPAAATSNSQTILKAFVGVILLIALCVAGLVSYLIVTRYCTPKPVPEQEYVELAT